MAAVSLSEALIMLRAYGKPFYVYVLCRPDGEPFYVGKGSGDRITKHEWEAARDDLDNHRLRIIRSICRGGDSIRYDIVGVYDLESDAFAEECRLIKEFGRLDQGLGALVNYTDGGEGCANPSDATIKKRAKKLRAIMKDPAYKAAAVAVLLKHRALRNERAIAALRTPEARERQRQVMHKKWADPLFRAKTMAGTAASRDLVWKAKHAEGIARAQADPEFHARRNAGVRSPEARARNSAIARRPEAIANKRALATAQRAAQTQARERVLSLARALGVEARLPDYRSGIRAWLDLELRFTAEGFL